MDEVEKLLEKAIAENESVNATLYRTGGYDTEKYRFIDIEKFNQALVLLRSKPPAGKLTAELINVWNEYLSVSTTVLDVSKKRELAQKVNDLIGKACDLLDAKDACIDEIEAVACGEKQVAEDDSEGMGWIYQRIQTLKAPK